MIVGPTQQPCVQPAAATITVHIYSNAKADCPINTDPSDLNTRLASNSSLEAKLWTRAPGGCRSKCGQGGTGGDRGGPSQGREGPCSRATHTAGSKKNVGGHLLREGARGSHSATPVHPGCFGRVFITRVHVPPFSLATVHMPPTPWACLLCLEV